MSVFCSATGRMNAALRLHGHNRLLLLQPFKPYLRLLLSGLNKMPLVKGKVYRGVGDKLNEVRPIMGKWMH